MQRDTVGFDLDGVVANLKVILADIFSKEIGRPVHENEWVGTGYDFHRLYGISDQRLSDLLLERNALESVGIVDGAKEAMDAIRDAGLGIAIVTARAFHPRGEAVTRIWLDAGLLPYDSVSLIHHSETKRDVMASMPHIIAYLDDYLGHLDAIAASKHPAKLFVMHQTYNAHDQRYNRIHCLKDYAQAAIAIHAARRIQAHHPNPTERFFA